MSAHFDLSRLAFRMSRPCRSCPFRRDVDPRQHLAVIGGSRRIREVATELPRGAWACHETTLHDPDDPDREIGATERTQHCAGALLVLERQDTPSVLRRLVSKHRLGFVADLDLTAPTFDSLAEMADAYACAEAQP